MTERRGAIAGSIRDRRQAGSGRGCRHGGASWRTRVPDPLVPVAAEQPSNGRVRRIAREPDAICARGDGEGGPCSPSSFLLPVPFLPLLGFVKQGILFSGEEEGRCGKENHDGSTADKICVLMALARRLVCLFEAINCEKSCLRRLELPDACREAVLLAVRLHHVDSHRCFSTSCLLASTMATLPPNNQKPLQYHSFLSSDQNVPLLSAVGFDKPSNNVACAYSRNHEHSASTEVAFLPTTRSHSNHSG